MSAPVIRLNGDASVVQISNGDSIVRIPIQLRRRSGQRRLRPAKVQCAQPSTDLTALQGALARGYRWRDMLDQGDVASTKEIAEGENVDRSYVSRMINMTMLAPEIIEAILDDMLPDFTLANIAIAPPDLWGDQFRKYRLRRTPTGLVRDA